MTTAEIENTRHAIVALALELPSDVYSDISPLLFAVVIKLEKAKGERDELKAKFDFTYCAYCGEEFPADDNAATQVGKHIKTCSKHPMRDVEAELTKYKAVVERVRQCERNIDLLITDPTRAEVKASYRDCLEPVDTQ